jgi:predicted GIY-YIG superfamily endonuclease
MRYGVMPRRSEITSKHSEDGLLMYFVYSIQSKNNPDRYYVGLTSDVERRLEEHNAGKSIHTQKFRPWKLVSYTAFIDNARAEKFETYLKTSSGRAFAKKRL